MNRNGYWSEVVNTARSLITGLRITLGHIKRSVKSTPPTPVMNADYFKNQQGIATIQYPHVNLPVPDNGRYRLHNEIDDCIVCDKCAKICPVNCITIEPVRAVEEIGKTSDGTSKRIYAATFDINMAQCCFCGLCTTVCPTECLTMTKVYDFSVSDISEHTYAFAEMTPEEIEEKKKIFEEAQKLKSAAKPSDVSAGNAPKAAGKPVFKPKIKPPDSNETA